jgi:WD40 repeat protein
MTLHDIGSVSFSPDSRTLYTGHADGLVGAWDSETATTLGPFRGSTAGIASVAASPDGQYVAAGAQDGSVVVWDVRTRDEVARVSPNDIPVACLRWSHDGRRMAIARGSYSEHATGGAIVVWTPADGTIVREIPLSMPVGAVTWVAHDRALLAATWDGNATLIDLATGLPLSRPVDLGLNRKNVVSAAWWSPDCPLLPRGVADVLFMGNER